MNSGDDQHHRTQLSNFRDAIGLLSTSLVLQLPSTGLHQFLQLTGTAVDLGDMAQREEETGATQQTKQEASRRESADPALGARAGTGTKVHA
jgi:hypothetical protein